MRYLIALLALVFASTANAQNVMGPAVVCDKPEQIENAYDYFLTGVTQEQAIDMANKTAKDDTACGLIMVVLSVKNVVKHFATHDIVEVAILGLLTPQGVVPLPTPMKQFAARPRQPEPSKLEL